MIFHIARAAAWSEAGAAGEYRDDSLAAEGFIHCSRADQWPRVLERRFSGAAGLVLLEIDETRLDATLLVWESADGGEEQFPHLYGPIPVAAVVGARSLAD